VLQDDFDGIRCVSGKSDMGVYVSESSEVPRMFFEHYDLIEYFHILSENVSAFSGDLTEVGLARHERFRAFAHQ
jgi:hypothetical protein